MLLAGDVGGTKTNLACFEVEGGRLKPVVADTFSSHAHASLDEIVRQFVSTHGLRVEHASFGIAGPVRRGRCEATNLAWVVDARQLASELGFETVTLMNDLEANAYGIAALEPRDFAVLNEGAPDAAGNAAVIAAGTGLGEAGLYWDGRRAPKIVAKLTDGTFMRAFTAKGRLKPVLEAMPVRVILNDKSALLGAARCAYLSMSGEDAGGVG
jgi:glucokinase